MQQKEQNFANNGKVSIRQMKRMLFLELFGLSTLVLPGPLAKVCQADGLFTILIAAAVWALLISFLGKMPSKTTARERDGVLPQIFLKGKLILGIIIFAVLAGFLLYLIVSLVERQLLDAGYLWVIILTVLFAGGYGIVKGLECRARIYEILFWVLMIPLAVILLIGVWNIHADYWLPVFACGWPAFGAGILICMGAFFPSVLCLFLKSSCDCPSKTGSEGAKIVWRAGCCCGLVYLILLGVFQSPLLSVLKYPILSLMAVVQMPGNLVERLDAPMMMIWFFSLFALFHSLCYYCVYFLSQLLPNKKYNGRKVVIGMILILLSGLMLLLGGCGKRGPEENLYPLAMGMELEKDTDMLNVSYACAQSGGSQNTSAKSGEEITDNVLLTTADSLFEAQKQVSSQSDKTVDLNHMKVFVIDRKLLQDEEERQQMFAYFLENENMAWNAYVVLTEESVQEIMSGGGGGKSTGEFLEQLLESNQEIDEKQIFTVKDFMNLYQNKNETALVPVISSKDGKLLVENYCIISRGCDRGILDLNESSYGNILLEKQDKISFLIEKDVYVSLQDITVEREISTDNRDIPQQNILIKGKMKISADWMFSNDKKEVILALASEKLEEKLNTLVAAVKEEKHADLTNSFLGLSGYCRPLWKLYRDNPATYEKKLNTDVQVQLKIVDT